jgi:hypothetical protein
MLAKVQSLPALTPSTKSINVEFDPTTVPAEFQFDPSFLEIAETTTISVTLTGATFASVPVTWQNPPSTGVPAVIMAIDSTDISFQVPAPAHYFVPWIFSLNVNFGTVTNITSPSCFLVRPKDVPASFTLEYRSTQGSFHLQHADQSADIELANQQILINVLPGSFTITLGSSVAATFEELAPIVWGVAAPSWISVSTPPVDNTLTFTTTEPIDGQSAGFQFAIGLPNGLGGNITILSPDPILVNATIGDG